MLKKHDGNWGKTVDRVNEKFASGNGVARKYNKVELKVRFQDISRLLFSQF